MVFCWVPAGDFGGKTGELLGVCGNVLMMFERRVWFKRCDDKQRRDCRPPFCFELFEQSTWF